ncbi:MAG: hypothetical protein EHM70_20335 [Chloroflexota bacterium]|nr:MAG: hypothetical protein EHM70_20335 [Chloroflexota bacterium]
MDMYGPTLLLLVAGGLLLLGIIVTGLVVLIVVLARRQRYAQPAYPPVQATPGYPPPGYPPQPYAASPQPYYYPAQAYAPRSGGSGCLKWLACGCVMMFLAVAVVGAGGYFAYTSGILTLDNLMELAGMGPAYIEIDNFRDEPITVSIVQLDVAEDDYPITAFYELNSFDIKVSTIGEAGRYQVDFGFSGGGADLGTCILTLSGGDQIQFVPLPDQIVVNDVKDPVSTGSDLVVSTSSLCR